MHFTKSISKSYIVAVIVVSVVNYFSLHSNKFYLSFIRRHDWISNSWQVEIFAFHLSDSKGIKLSSCQKRRTFYILHCFSDYCKRNYVSLSANMNEFETHTRWKLANTRLHVLPWNNDGIHRGYAEHETPRSPAYREFIGKYLACNAIVGRGSWYAN